MKVDFVYHVFLFLGFLFVVIATFLYVCLLGYSNEKWTSFNEIFCLIAEVIIFIYMIFFVSSGAKKLENRESPSAVAYLCDKIRISTLYAMGYSVVQLFFPDVDACLSVVYCVNIFMVASFFFVWMTVKKNNIERGGTMGYFY